MHTNSYSGPRLFCSSVVRNIENMAEPDGYLQDGNTKTVKVNYYIRKLK